MQRRCNTHDLPVVTSFLFSLQVRSLFLLQADFLSLEFSLFLLSRDFVRLYFSFRCEATFMSPRIVFFIFVSVSCIHSGRWIHQIHADGQTSYKMRQKFRRLKKASRRIFVSNFSPFKSRTSFARFSRAWRMRMTNSPARKLVPATLKWNVGACVTRVTPWQPNFIS